jgi:Na+/H+ antiporter NhaD/arsenite permease-like protein
MHLGIAIFAVTYVLISARQLGWLGLDLAWTAVGGCAALLVLQPDPPSEVWDRIDWSILLFFAGLFVVVEAFVQSGAPAWMFERFPLWHGDGLAAWLRLAAVFLFGSNVVSNVPFTLVVRPARSDDDSVLTFCQLRPKRSLSAFPRTAL